MKFQLRESIRMIILDLNILFSFIKVEGTDHKENKFKSLIKGILFSYSKTYLIVTGISIYNKIHHHSCVNQAYPHAYIVHKFKRLCMIIKRGTYQLRYDPCLRRSTR